MSMNIYAPEGTLVRFVPGNNAYPSENERARSILELNQTYTVEYTDVGSWCSYVCLKEFPTQQFNTVLFEDVDEPSL